jgi:pimeloyl-ACP methyl ester carboxylesterase
MTTATATGFTEGAVELDRMRIHVRDVGHGPPILLINGIGAHTAMWAPLEHALEGFRTISFDAPGAGRSSTPLLPVTVPRLARLAALVLDHVGVEQADVLGYSMGGAVLQQLCADAPQRVRRAVLVATTPGLGGIHGDALAMLNLVTPVRYLSPRLYSMTIGSLAGGRARTDGEWVARYGVLRQRSVPSLRGYFSQLMSVSGWSSLQLLRRIDLPVLVVTGDDDPLIPVANAMLLTHLLPDARLMVLHSEGHLMLMDDQSPAPDHIREFLAAPTLEDAPVWSEAQVVERNDVQTALAGRSVWQAQPWGLISGCLRRRHLGT